MKIAILGTRGIPNSYGGFEQFAEYFSVYLKEQGHQVYVYCSSLHLYKKSNFKGVELIHCFDPEDKLGTAGQFVYDFNCILDSRKRNFDTILQLGYTSNSIWHFLLPKNPIIITNMDGLEWKRSKYSSKVQKFLKYAEKLAVKSSDYLISDSVGIQSYLRNKYKRESKYIAYGSSIFESGDESTLQKYNLKPYDYHLLVARLEPENNVEIAIQGVLKSRNDKKLYIVGGYSKTEYGRRLYSKYRQEDKIQFLGGIYNQEELNSLRYYSDLYFHGHSVGGTNPSLLEAMGSRCLVVAHNNVFNKSVLKGNAFYFSNLEEVKTIVDKINKGKYEHYLDLNQDEIRGNYSWELINKTYLEYIEQCLRKGK
ncbi:MAG: DUF1972 domain-containing protein [Flavobacteriales bacterium]|nr:DUF1972 domain-containing protein [Flavobacteriales bacterium]